MNDTTWFWQIVDARGLADVSSDEFVALNELISKAERTEEAESALTAKDSELAEARAALEPFVRAFDTAREKHGRRYGKDAAVGLKNFDKMPDRWPMDHLTFDMGTFRRARTVLSREKEASHD